MTHPARAFALAAVLAAAALAGCGGPSTPAADVDHLVVYSPHSDEIEQEFNTAFAAWYKAETGRDVDVSVPDAGGTSQILKRIQDKFLAGRHDVDVVFGGGPIFERMKQLGFLAPYELPDPLLAQLPKTVAGQPLYDEDYAWYGAAISSFGLIINTKVLSDRGLPMPTAWEAMGDPRYMDLVGGGDPTKSGSVRKAYEIILQAYGYDVGMALLARMGGCAREFYAGGSDIPRNTARGLIAMGPCIDFYAARQKVSEGGEHVAFVAPEGMTVVNCDPIGILAKAPNRAVAEKYVAFVMSPASQRLWMLPPGSEGGPKEHALQRLAVLPHLYTEAEAAGATPSMNPFELPPSDFFDTEKEVARIAVMPAYLHVALVENHGPLKEAFKAVVEAGAPEALMARLTEPLVREEEMLRLGREVWTPVVIPEDATDEEAETLKAEDEARLRRRSDIEVRWSETLRDRYETLADAARAAAAGVPATP